MYALCGRRAFISQCLPARVTKRTCSDALSAIGVSHNIAQLAASYLEGELVLIIAGKTPRSADDFAFRLAPLHIQVDGRGPEQYDSLPDVSTEAEREECDAGYSNWGIYIGKVCRHKFASISLAARRARSISRDLSSKSTNLRRSSGRSALAVHSLRAC